MARPLIPVALVAALLVICSCRGGDSSIPVIPVDLNKGTLTITNWRVTGPFRLPDKDQKGYTQLGLQEAFGHDYLAEIKGREVPLMLPSPTTYRPVDFTRDPNDEPDIGPAEVQFIDQVQQFPTPSVNTQTLFRKAGEFFKVTYGAAVLSSETDTEAALIVSGNSPVKVWLNDKEILQSPASVVGHDPDILHILTVPLRRGDNKLLVKMFCFPKRNEFVVRVATRERALAFAREHGGLRDVLEEAVVQPGQPLLLSHNLPFFSPRNPAEARVEITDRDGRGLLSKVIDLGSRAEIQTTGFARGLYKITASVGEWTFSENFYIGERDKIAAPYEERCLAERNPPERLPDACAALEHLRKVSNHARSSYRLDWQKNALFLLEQLEWGLAEPPADGPPPHAPRGVRMFAYRSRIDSQKQYYFLHLPKGYDGRSVPLVVVNPHNTVQKPLLGGPLVTRPDGLRKLSTFADEFGYACLWTHGRGRNNNVHLALADTLEALEDVQRRFAIDAERVYLTGDCGGARNALLFAQRFPDRVAAVSVLNSATTSGLTANELWQAGNSPRAATENLLNIPLQLIHGDHFPHSPTEQSVELRDAARRAGMEPELILLPGDTRWADEDALRLSFAFFQGKSRQTPRTVALTTGQLKYGSAYWLRVTELAAPPRLGKVSARFDAPGRMTVRASDVAELEFLPGRFPAGVPRSGTLEIDVNGEIHTVTLENDGPLRLRLSPAEGDAALKKTAALEGPVSHAFVEPFVIVQATGGSQQEQELSKKLADQIEKGWRDNYFVSCPRKTEEEVTPEDVAAFNLVVAGGPNVNETLKRVFGSLPFGLDAGGVSVGGVRVESSRVLLSAVYPNPLNPRRYVVLVASNSPDAAGLPAPELARSGSYDVAVWRVDGGQGSRLLGEWYWDKSWTRLIPAGAVVEEGDGGEAE
jgi:dienelactone hydrolase